MTRSKVNRLVTALGLATLTAATAVSAQDQATLLEAFSGDWYVFEPGLSANGDACALTLSDTGSPSGYEAAAENCAAPLAEVTSWLIRDGQIVLQAPGDIAALGGNQQRITGEFTETGRGLIVERSSGDAHSARIREAISRHKCIYLGFTDTCAGSDQLGEITAREAAPARLEVLANLNLRSQPRADAPVVGVIPKDTDLTATQCLVASDGLWCRTAFEGQSGWITRNAVREGGWPIATFVSTTAPNS